MSSPNISELIFHDFAISQHYNAISKNPASMSSSPWRVKSKYVQILNFGHVLGELCGTENTRQLALYVLTIPRNLNHLLKSIVT